MSMIVFVVVMIVSSQSNSKQKHENKLQNNGLVSVGETAKLVDYLNPVVIDSE